MRALGAGELGLVMRLIIDTLIALLLACILAGVLIHYRQQQWEMYAQQQVHQSLARLHEQAIYRGAMAEVPLSKTGFPLAILPTWFGSDLPQNLMAPGRNPWLDIAPEGDRCDQPPDPVVTSDDQACFWYNPQRGIFRARVQPQSNDEETLRLYNKINGTALKALPRVVDASRRPVPLNLADATAPASDQPLIRNTARPTANGKPRPTLLSQ